MRKRFVAVGMCVVGLATPGIADEEKGKDICICPSSTAATVAWCAQCKTGVAFGRRIKSEKLTAALNGKEVNESAIKCGGCKTAFKVNGRCSHCKVSFSGGKAYNSPVALALSKGEVISPAKIRCAGCKTNFEKGKGFCTHCNAGVLAGLMFKNEKDYSAAQEAEAILTTAIKTADTCQACAVAMVTDGQCSQCKVSFKNGEPQKQ